MMTDCRDRRMVMLMFTSGAAWVAVTGDKGTANYISVNYVESMIR